MTETPQDLASGRRPPELPPAPAPPGPEADMAASSMAHALRMSFRLLTIVMAIVVAVFLSTGLKRIHDTQAGIRTVFGRVVGVAGPGLQYNWPFPVGDIEIVDVSQRTVKVNDFSMHRTPEQMGKKVSELVAVGEGLRPGLDGALLTGDAYLLHVQFECFYVVKPADALMHYRNVRDANEVVRSAVCSAAIRAAATRTAEGLVGGEEQNAFKAETLQRAQEVLDAIASGLTLTRINLVDPTWPLRALPEYNAAQRAGQERQELEEKARTAAGKFLGDVAGPNYRRLVGEPWGAVGPSTEDPNYNLIGQYEAARADPNLHSPAEALLAQIDAVLLSRDTTGEVAGVLAGAASYATMLTQQAKGRADRFEQLLPRYLATPELLLNEEWTRTRERILASPTVVKWYRPPGGARTVVQVNTPPEITKEMLKAWLEAGKRPRDQSPPAGR